MGGTAARSPARSQAPGHADTGPPEDAATDPAAIHWLLACDEPGIRLQARRELLDEELTEPDEAVLEGPRVRALFEGQEPEGGFGVHPYHKWLGAHWRLVALVELGIPAGEPRALAPYETVLGWLLGQAQRRNVPVIDGRARRCASQEGNALAVGCRLGLAGDQRVGRLAQALIGWQWPDGGWNCDRRAAAEHSSFNESVTPLWGLAEYAHATGDATATAAARRACELLLDHQVYLSHTTGKVGNPKWLDARYPPYWRYDLHQGLLMLARAEALPDDRADQALDELEQRRDEAGRWSVAGAPMWSAAGRHYPDAVAWERRGPSLMLTLNGLRILRAAGRLQLARG